MKNLNHPKVITRSTLNTCAIMSSEEQSQKSQNSEKRYNGCGKNL